MLWKQVEAAGAWLIGAVGRISRHQGGSTVIMFSLATIPLFAAVGAAVDYSTATRLQATLQVALDAGTLAAASRSMQGGSTATTSVSNYVQAQFRARDGRPTVTASIDATGSVTASASLAVPTSFMRIVGVTSLNVAARSTAGFGAGNAEVALVLDTTGSMAGAKLAGVQQATNDLIATLYATPGSATKVKMSLVPFSNYVRIATSYRNAAWLSVAADTSTTTTSCYTQYTGGVCTPYTTTCYSDGTAYPCSGQTCTGQIGTRVCGPSTSTVSWNGCVGSRNHPKDLRDVVDPTDPVPGLMNTGCGAELVRLTNDSALLQSKVAALNAGGETYIAPGILWGWRTLSPNAPFGDGAAYSNGTMKVLVLMTDGANTKSPNYPNHEGNSESLANRLTEQTCANVKAAGIKIYTIAFQVTDPTIKNVLSNCASGPPFYYDASTMSGMTSAFTSIGQSLTAVRLVR
jgi:Flp pilus assembly protein TadG